MKRSHSLLALLGFGGAVAVAALYGSRYSPKDKKIKDWYDSLDKPVYTPPNAVFPAVWSSLYLLMAYSGWKTWNAEDSPERSRALRLWMEQLVANAQWTKLFFGDQNPERALTDSVALETILINYIMTARKVEPKAAAAFLPYAAWVAFATLLNAEIAKRNSNSPIPITSAETEVA